MSAEDHQQHIERLTEELATARAELAALRAEQETWAEKDAKVRTQRDRATKSADELSAALATRLRLDTAGRGRGAALRKDRQKPVTRTEAAHLELIRASSLFDDAWYLRTYHDVAHLGEDPALHFLRHPFNPFRRPSEDFNIGQYVIDHPEVLTDQVNPLVHFLLSPESAGADAYPPRLR